MNEPLDGQGAHPNQPIGSGYVLESLIGSGAMGQVWKAWTRSGESVAMKLLHVDLTRDPAFVARFLQEAQVLTKVTGPGLVVVRDLVAEGSRIAIVMDLIDGPDLRAELARRGTFEPSRAGETIYKVLGGLAAVHSAGIVHRDIKPENVLLAPMEPGVDPRITDFGVARIIEEGPASRTTVIGTPEYIAPEVADGALPTPQSDLYAVGMMFYELLVGVTPFAGGSPLAVMRRHVEQQPGRPEGIPDDLWAFITWLVAKNPADRPESAGAAQARLNEIAAQLVTLPALRKHETPPAPPITAQATVLGTRRDVPIGVLATGAATTRNRRPRRRILIAAGALVLVGGGVAAAALLGGGATSTANDGPDPIAASSPTTRTTPTRTATPTPTPTETVPDGVPSVTGLQLAQATIALRNAGFVVEVSEVVDEAQADGTVVAQVPEGGELAPESSRVTLTVSRRPVAQFLADVAPVEGDVDTGTQALNGQQYVHSLYWSVQGCWGGDVRYVQYNLGRHYRELRATAGLGDTSYSDGKQRLEVIADGRIVWSNDLTLGATMPVDVDLSGVLRLELRSTSLGTECSDEYPTYADAQILGLASEVPARSATLSQDN